MHVTGKVLGLEETIQAFAGIPSLLRQVALAAMTESLELLSKTVRHDFLQGPYPTEIERRSGSFRATFARGDSENIWQVRADGTTILGTFGSEDKRARILNDGGTIRSSRPGGYLAVRTEFTKTARGVVMVKYQQPLRTLPHTFVRRIVAPKARAAVFERIGRRVIPIAWLVKEVTIVGRKFLEKTEAKAGPLIPGIFQQRLDIVVQRLQETLRRVGGR